MEKKTRNFVIGKKHDRLGAVAQLAADLFIVKGHGFKPSTTAQTIHQAVIKAASKCPSEKIKLEMDLGPKT